MVTIKNIITATRCAKKIMIAVALQLYVLAPANSYAQNKINDNVIEAANVLKGINDMVTLTKYFQDTALGDSNDQATANFYNEKAAMLIQGLSKAGGVPESVQLLDPRGKAGGPRKRTPKLTTKEKF